MTSDRARDILNAVSLGRGTGHVYTDAEAASLLALARSLAGVARAVPGPARAALTAASGAAETPAARPERPRLSLVVLGRAA